jgi:hypothetical protein
MITNLGHALSILASAEAAEHFMHADVEAFHAPSECHGLVSRGEAERARQARKHAEATARRPLRLIVREAQRRGGVTPCSGDPKWQAIVGRVYANTYPF